MRPGLPLLCAVLLAWAGSGAPHAAPNETAPARHSSLGRIELYAQAGFRGARLQLDDDVIDLQRNRFNDRAASVVVRSGIWVLCTDAQFSGRCRAFTPGAYPDLAYGMDDRVSSARLARPPAEVARVAPVGDFTALPPFRTDGSHMILFSEPGLGGNSIAVAGPVSDLRSAGFNDATASLVVEKGRWQLCTEANFRGQCRVLGPGRRDGLREVGFDHDIASLRPVSG